MKLILAFCLLLSSWAYAQDLSDAVSAWTKKPSRKVAPLPAVTASPESPDLPTLREKCNQGSDEKQPPQIVSAPKSCAKNLTEALKLFPKQKASLLALNGAWSDVLTGDYEERVYKFQKEKAGNNLKNDQVPLQIEQSKTNLFATSSEFKIQLEDFDKNAKVNRSEVLKAELCSGPEGFYFKTPERNIALKFQNPQCLWVSMNGQWTAQRKFAEDPEGSLPAKQRQSTEGAK